MKDNIKYTNRDYDALMKTMIDNIKYYYPNSVNDFSPASPAMIVLQLIAYVGDVLNFYIDRQVKESLLPFAEEKSSIYNIAQSYGYKIKTAIPASVQLTFQYLVPAIGDNSAPDLTYAPILEPGILVNSTKASNTMFTVINSVNFKDPYRSQYLPVFKNGNTYFIIRKFVQGYSIRKTEFQYTFDTTVRDQMKLTLPGKNIVKIQSVEDSDGNYWYEVDNLASAVVLNPNKLYKDGASVLQRKQTSKRFKRFVDATDATNLYFGSGIRSNKSETQMYEKFRQFNSTDIQSSMLVLDSNYGQIPYNTTLTITYYTSTQMNVGSMYIDNIISVSYAQQFESRPADFNAYNSTLLVYNSKPSIAGQSIQPPSQIKQNTFALMSSQQRLVTLSDYYNVLKLIPAEYGVIGKSYLQRDAVTNKLKLYVLSLNNSGLLSQTNFQVKKNIGQFLEAYRMIGQSIEICDAKIINVQCKFVVVAAANYNKSQILYKAILKVKQYFNISNFDIGTPIQKYKLQNMLLGVPGVINVPEIRMMSMYDSTGVIYSSNFYDMQNAESDGSYFTATYPSIFELKYPDKDIIGSVI